MEEQPGTRNSQPPPCANGHQSYVTICLLFLLSSMYMSSHTTVLQFVPPFPLSFIVQGCCQRLACLYHVFYLRGGLPLPTQPRIKTFMSFMYMSSHTTMLQFSPPSFGLWFYKAAVRDWHASLSLLLSLSLSLSLYLSLYLSLFESQTRFSRAPHMKPHWRLNWRLN